ncbi:unnamed protein product [Paramecium primaurelia]|uniref:Cysteine dioxygenase n=1 Tax=Paramecium primaurelia TaxID=5886 RepID=A0A8S1P031_PARPR|nr:unnamed protein product [Paramecium primaurelia]
MQEDSNYTLETNESRTEIKFEQDEKIIVIVINPSKIESQFQDYFQQMKKIVIKYLDMNQDTCLEIKYSRKKLKISSGSITEMHNDQRIVMFTNQLGQLMDTQGIWAHLNKANCSLNIGYGEPRFETQIITRTMNQVMVRIKSINGTNKINYQNCNQSVQIHSKDYFIYKLSPVISKNCNNIIDLHNGSQPINLASEINNLFQSVKKIELHEIEQKESPYYEQKGAKLSLGYLIHHSVTHNGCKLNEILKRKQENAKLKGLDPFMTYLRLGLGHYNKYSAGHQYVLEIWPFKHYSTIHDHAGQYGIVKVLQGVIDVKIYAILSNARHLMNPILHLTCNKNDMTWVSPKLNQVHQLKNFYPQTAITLQCYKYPKQSQNNNREMAFVAKDQYLNFTPLSDFPDIELDIIFRELVEEYSNYYKIL